MEEDPLVTVEEDGNHSEKVICKMGNDGRENAIRPEDEEPKVYSQNDEWKKREGVEVISAKDDTGENDGPPTFKPSFKVPLDETSKQQLLTKGGDEGNDDQNVEQLRDGT